jgi:two-component system, sensor histidine kinase and response regulator
MVETFRELASDVPSRVRWVFRVSLLLVVAYLISLVARSAGSYSTPIDGWGVDVFEIGVGAVCASRFLNGTWRSTHSVARVFPVIFGAASISWALGDVALTIESLGGATPSVPSVADGFYIGFFPLCFAGLALLIRGGNRNSLLETSLDGLIAGLGVASISAAYLFKAIMHASGGGDLSTAFNMAYPCGDVLLMALAIGAFVVLSKEYRPFLAIVAFALAANAIGDTYNLLAPDSKAGYVANSVAWPISLLLIAIAVWAFPAHLERPVRDRIAGFAMPGVGALGAIFILFGAGFGHIGRPAVGLATATLLVAGARLAFSVHEAQALNSARFRSLIDNAWDLIVVTEANFEVAFVTPSLERVLGYEPVSIERTLLTDLVHPDDLEPLRHHLSRLGDGATAVAAFEARLRHQSGVWRTIAWTVTNQLSDPSVLGYVLNGSDVTEERQATEDLASARDGALAASKAKSDFLSTMSHEIRTPMNGVIGLTGLLLETSLDTEQLELARGVKISAENLLVIVDDILDFSKIEAGQLDIEDAELDLPKVAENVGRILAGTAHGKGVELLIDVEPDVPQELIGDPVRIQQVLLNLGSNAVKFTSEGEVLIRITLVRGSSQRCVLRFDVTDTGIGIAEADQQRLFRPFAQADSSTTRRFGGTGLGLAISRQLVELMGGKLGLVSAPGNGSTFFFELSLARTVKESVRPARYASRGLIGQRALIVDDNATNRLILRRQLTAWGVETVEAADGYEALSLCATAAGDGELFDFGVVDLNMPGMDGIALAHELKADPSTESMSLFLLSSSGARYAAGATDLQGFAASLTKPVRSSELFDCLVVSLGDELAFNLETAIGAPVEGGGATGLILLVEDNKVNQLVGSKVLERLGYRFEIANHGGEALAAVAAASYDAILMDCQMPEMDGYEATSEIRRLEGSERHTPIIAMTAAAMDGDRERCLEAGMDDYITKPVRMESVAEVLARWVSPEGPVETEVYEATVPQDLHVLDEAQIGLLRTLDDGEGTLLSEIVGEFIAQTDDGRQNVAKLVRESDAPALARAAHTLKGASANVGASALAAVCAGMEMQARMGKLDGAGALMEQFDVEFARARDALRELLVGSPGEM